jgi:hypothetical protein
MERAEMDPKTTAVVNDEFRRIADKWIRGRVEIARLQGSGLVIAGNTGPARALLTLIDECSSDMAALVGPLPPDYLQAIGEVYYAWKNKI